MDYTEHAPPADLRRHVQCLRALRGDRNGDDALRLAAAFVRGRSG